MNDFFKRMFGHLAKETQKETSVNKEVQLFLNDFINEAIDAKEGYTIKLSTLEHYKTLKTKSVGFKKDVIRLLIYYKNIGYRGINNSWAKESYYVKDVFSKLVSLLMRLSDLTFDEDELLQLSKELSAKKKDYFYTSEWPIVPFLSRVEKLAKNTTLTPKLKQSLNHIQKLVSNQRYVYADETKVLNKIKLIKEGPKQFSVSDSDKLGGAILNTAKAFKGEKQEAFISLLNHFSKGREKSTPTKAWFKDCNSKIELIGEEFLVTSFISWIGLIIQQLKVIHKEKTYEFTFASDENVQLLRSAIWMSSLLNDNNLNQAVEDLGLWSFKKLSGYGAVSVKLGNACIYTFSKLPYKDGVSRLTKFRMKIKYPSVQSLITKAIVRVAEAEGKTMDEIEELAVQDYKLNNDYQLTKSFDSYKGIITIIDSSTITLLWENEKGKQIKTIPKYVRDNFPTELRVLKKQVKDIQSNLSAQKNRIEKIFLSKRRWTYSQWEELYLENKLLAFFGTKLIWNFTESNKTISAIFHKGKFVNTQGTTNIDFKKSIVELWHPVTATVKEVELWRTWLVKNKVKQPFKQAHREVYIVTDAEKTTNSYSNRYAAHIIRQHIFNALCRERGWRYQLQGQWDSHNIPTLYIPSWKYRIEFWTETEGVHDSANDMGIFNYLQTDQVRFYDEFNQVNMIDVPAIVFSECMRDVDLFVGVTSIGADPNWRDGGEERFHGYWSSFSFGELATSGIERKSLLENLIPKLQIKDQCSFEGNFLIVKGKLRIYKIHMGSGNILMKPNDQYLCIVADRKKEANVFLPFEGDSTLATILSKAFMLANDDKIKDKTITSQIDRH
ncbi:DUF4132 domain-containing protein [Flavivirga spongiicola]|uniref:DUF4132 domain-containing protein n=1 Tax=Flavivirga spongiicola TaxID=421621 RepID=A0ABU7XUT6_9FLAO|nr:DUF4132 domain-containing protein [Flavivirga sp. MEBiC05379]MDO5979189.1 DUF4132 domain-containing protein [Flavivirga sp. MEBiC05379]